MNNRRRELIQKIKNAFANTEYPGDDNIARQDCCEECYQMYVQFKDKTWQEFNDVTFLRYHSNALALFKREALQYYLPAFMCITISDDSSIDSATVASDVQTTLIPYISSQEVEQEWMDQFGTNYTDYCFERIKGFTKEQKAVIHEYLTFMLLPSKPPYPEAEQRALDFWSNPNL